MREIPVIDESRCTGCGDCAAVCPARCLTVTNKSPWLVRPADCVSCAACVAICTPAALVLRPLPAA